jgi:hypothetical protein
MRKLKRRYRKAFLKGLSQVLGNMSAGWFSVSLIAPTVFFPKTADQLIALTGQIILGIVFLVLATLCEKKLEK